MDDVSEENATDYEIPQPHPQSSLLPENSRRPLATEVEGSNITL